MLFSTDAMLEEMYSVCIQLVNKTWKEMRATSRDFSRVRYLHFDQSISNIVAFPPCLLGSKLFHNKLSLFHDRESDVFSCSPWPKAKPLETQLLDIRFC